MNTNLIDTKSGFGVRPYTVEDIPAIHQAIQESFPELYAWTSWCHPGYSIEDAKDWIEIAFKAWDERKAFPFAIYALQSNEFVGGVGLDDLDRTHKTANLGYWVHTGFTRRGAASTAARLCTQFGFHELDLQRVEIIASVENVASQRAAAKAGATREGILRNGLNYHGKPHDAVIFSFIPSDFAPGD